MQSVVVLLTPPVNYKYHRVVLHPWQSTLRSTSLISITLILSHSPFNSQYNMVGGCLALHGSSPVFTRNKFFCQFSFYSISSSSGHQTSHHISTLYQRRVDIMYERWTKTCHDGMCITDKITEWEDHLSEY